ncbi:MAG: IclR family transcriptional regulator C-terminal domain-containing protein, partial [Desulfobacterales bacterium]
EMENGVRCIAALIFDHKGKATAAVSISGAAMRITPDRIDYFGQKVKECTSAISRELGFVQMK